MTEENNEVRDPSGLLEAYNNLKEDIRKARKDIEDLTAERDGLKKAAEEDEWRTRAVLAETKSALAKQGIKDPEKVLKYVKTDGLDFDENGNLTGFEDKYKEWAADLPEVFDAKRRAGGKADIFADNPSDAKPNPLRAAVHHALNG